MGLRTAKRMPGLKELRTGMKILVEVTGKVMDYDARDLQEPQS